MAEVRSEYIACGGNRHPSAADWDVSSGLLAYGADRNIALWSPLNNDFRGVQALLRAHTDTVNAVKFFPTPPNQPMIILSGSVDRTLRVWREQSPTAFELVATLDGHNGSVNCIAVFPGVNVVASGSADATIKIWRVDCGGEVIIQAVQSIETHPRLFPLALALHSLHAADGFVLAAAGTRSDVQIYVASKDGFFIHKTTLTGHEGWIRSLAITRETLSAESDLLLASASQDKYIRLWRITKGKEKLEENGRNPILAFERSLSNKAYKLEVSRRLYEITFEALLLGHEDWIYSVSWRIDSNGLQLLSASADSSLAIWRSEESSGVWVSTTRLGEISAQKGSTTATGSTGGFWIGLWSPHGDGLVSLGRTGSWRLWSYDRYQTRWTQGIGISGHTKPVVDVAWSRDGLYLLSTSSDQTTRMHAAWKNGIKQSWHEMARPQIHGYDLNCIDSIGQTRFISGADEKLLRIFDEPRTTANLLVRLCGAKINDEAGLPEAANIPVLGLSNKAIEDDEEAPTESTEANGSTPASTTAIQAAMFESEHPPLEDQLARHTLWPEIEKLYGHGHEISAVAVCHDGTLVATSCRASSLDHAVIRLYATKDWREIKPSLTAHSLTVTALRFSEDDRCLLSVGRDRQWAVFERDAHSRESYLLKYSNPKGHSRMILSCCWAPLEAGRIFATAGRDKNVKIWSLNEETPVCSATITLASPATAVDVFPSCIKHALVVASGTETGEVCFHVLQIPEWTIQHTFKLDDS